MSWGMDGSFPLFSGLFSGSMLVAMVSPSIFPWCPHKMDTKWTPNGQSSQNVPQMMIKIFMNPNISSSFTSMSPHFLRVKSPISGEHRPFSPFPRPRGGSPWSPSGARSGPAPRPAAAHCGRPGWRCWDPRPGWDPAHPMWNHHEITMKSPCECLVKSWNPSKASFLMRNPCSCSPLASSNWLITSFKW